MYQYTLLFIQGLISVKHNLIGHFMYDDLPVSSLIHHTQRTENQRRYDNSRPDDLVLLTYAKAGMSYFQLTKTNESNHLKLTQCNNGIRVVTQCNNEIINLSFILYAYFILKSSNLPKQHG